MRESLQRARTSARQTLVRRHNPDYKIVMYTTILVVIGLIIIFAIGPQRANLLNESLGSQLPGMYFVIKQATSVLIAVASFFAFAYLFKVDALLKHSTAILGVGFGACVLLVLLGNIAHAESITQCALGACRWFVLPGLGTFQPAELLKFGILIFTAGFLAARQRAGLINHVEKTIIPVLALLGLAALFVIVLQRDLGTGIALFSIVASMLVAVGVKKEVGFVLLALVVVAGLIMIISAPHRIERVTTFLKGDETSIDDPAGYHITHAKIAIGSGGLLGVGIGNSVQAAGYLPEAINDSVFAILGETFGFVGLVFILVIFYLLLMRILQQIDHLERPEYKLVVAGVFGWIGSHVVINVAAMTGLVPLTGITLPFLSFGGTSMLFIAAALGVVFQISRYTVHGNKREELYEDTRSRRGSGGHVTPVAAVVEQLAAQHAADDELTVRFVCDRAFETQSRGIMAKVSVPVEATAITSGKLRRYAHLSLWQHLMHISIVGQNILDIFKVVIGFFQSLILIAQFRPDVVFAKGGFVCLPVGFAAWCLRRPLVIHDSDARPGLTSRLLARYATVIATGFPLENYSYPAAKSHYIGVPIEEAYVLVTSDEQAEYKRTLGFDASKPLIVAFGGGLGAVAINDAAVQLARELGDTATIYNGTGKANFERAEKQGEGLTNYRAEAFVYGLHDFMAAADIVITRASATALQELAGLGKPIIAVPARQLGDQQLNAKLFQSAGAAVVLQDDELSEPGVLAAAVRELLASPERQKVLADALHVFAKPDAASQLAGLIVGAHK